MTADMNNILLTRFMNIFSTLSDICFRALYAHMCSIQECSAWHVQKAWPARQRQVQITRLHYSLASLLCCIPHRADLVHHLPLLAPDNSAWISWNDKVLCAAQIQAALCKWCRASICEACYQLVNLQIYQGLHEPDGHGRQTCVRVGFF